MTAETRKGRSHGGPRGGLSPLGELVRRRDRDRYQTALFAPADRHEALFALYALNYEIARVRESVTQPMLGQIRLQWWREVIDAAYAGATPRRHEVAQPLTAAIQEFGLSRAHFDRMIDARETDLADEPPPDMATLEGYAEATSAELIRLALEVLEPGRSGSPPPRWGRVWVGVMQRPVMRNMLLESGRNTPTPALADQWGGSPQEGSVEWEPAVEAGAHVGIAYALAGLLRAMPFHARSGRCYIPADVATEAGLDPRDYSALRATPGLRRVVCRIAETAESHLMTARQVRAEVPRGALPALLPAVVAERALAQSRRVGWNPFDQRLAAPDTLQSWRLAVAAWRGRF